MYIINLDSVDLQTQGVGMKAAGLGILAKAGFQVPPGFVVITEAFEKFLTDTGIRISLPNILGAVNPEEPKTAFHASQRIREMFYRFSGNDFLIREVKDAYNELSFGKDVNIAGGLALDLVRAGRAEHFVSVRPSVACPQASCSFSGHGKAFLNVINYRQILSGVKDCWFSVFSPESIIYRKLHGIGSFSLAVIVQKMVDSELSGTLFTSEPLSGDREKILVEGFWGLGETLCCGCLSPDHFIIDRESGDLVSKRVGKKMWLRRRGPLSGMTIQEKVPASRVFMETLSERDFARFAGIARKVKEILKGPQEMEWAVERGRVVLLQSRPVVFSKVQDILSEGEKLASGIGVSGGIIRGKTVVISDFSDVQKPQEPGILVTKNLGMEILPYLKWFSGIVSEQGGCGSCLSSIGRELGVPIVAGVENATVILSGKEIVVDGGKGEVYSESSSP